MQPGDKASAVSKQVTLEKVRLFWGRPDKNIHTDEAVAREAGFTVPITPGLMSYAFLSEMLVSFFGQAWINRGTLEVSFIAPVFVGDTITANGVVMETLAEDTDIKIVLEVWCENQAGRKVAVGTARF